MLPRFERYRRHVQLYNDKVFIRGISSTTSKDGLESFLKARVSVVPTDIAFGETSRTALVTFEGPVDFDKLKLACQMITLDKCHLDVEKVPITKSVVVRGFGPNTSQDALEFYFNNRRRSGGTGVLETKMIAEEGVCIVSFEEPEAADVVCQRKHKLDGHELEVRIFHECLGLEFVFLESLDSKDLDIRKLQFLVQSEPSKAEIGRRLAGIHAQIVWPKNIKPMPLKVQCCFTKEVGDLRKLSKNWKKAVITEVTKFLDLMDVEMHSIVPDEWKSVRLCLQTLLNVARPDGIAVIPEKNSYELYIVGYKPAVEDLSKQVVTIVETVRQNMGRKKQKIHISCQVKHHYILLLHALRFGEEMSRKFQDFSVDYDFQKHRVLFECLACDIIEAKMAMFEIINKISKTDVGQFSQHRKEFFKSQEVKQYVRDRFSKSNVTAVSEIDSGNVTVFAINDDDAVKASRIMKDCVLETTVKIDEGSIPLLSSTIWADKVAAEMQKYPGLVKFIPQPQNREVVILCVDFNCGLLREFVNDFFARKTELDYGDDQSAERSKRGQNSAPQRREGGEWYSSSHISQLKANIEKKESVVKLPVTKWEEMQAELNAKSQQIEELTTRLANQRANIDHEDSADCFEIDEPKEMEGIGAQNPSGALDNDWQHCDVDEKHRNPNWKCIHCDEIFCEKCVKKHKRKEKNRYHRIIEKSERSLEKEIRSRHFCSKHGGEIQLYCKNDKDFICVKCMMEDHKGHDTDFLDKMADDERTNIGKSLNTVEVSAMSMIEDALGKIKLEENSLPEVKNNLIDDMCTEMISKIQRCATEMKESTTPTCADQQRLDELDRKRTELTTEMDRLVEASKKVRKVLENCGSPEIIQDAQAWQTMLQHNPDDLVHVPSEDYGKERKEEIQKILLAALQK